MVYPKIADFSSGVIVSLYTKYNHHHENHVGKSYSNEKTLYLYSLSSCAKIIVIG